VTQTARLPLERSVPISTYLFVGAIAFLTIASFLVLFFPSPLPSREWKGGEK
jgi:hypothetical protein